MCPATPLQGYTQILLHSSYFSLSLGQYINGSFYGQIYVQEPSTVNVKVKSYSSRDRLSPFTLTLLILTELK